MSERRHDCHAFFRVLVTQLYNIYYNKVTAHTLLDLTAAFDAIDLLILLSRLLGHVGISGTAHRWF